MTTQEIKVVVEEQIKNQEDNGDQFLEADEYKQQLDEYIKKYKENEAVLKAASPKSKKESKDSKQFKNENSKNPSIKESNPSQNESKHMESLVTNPSKKSTQKESSKNISKNISEIKSKETIKTVKSKEFSNPNQSVNKLDESIRSNNSKKESKKNLEDKKSTSKDKSITQDKKKDSKDIGSPDVKKSKDDLNKSQTITNNDTENLKASQDEKNESKSKDIELNEIKENNEHEQEEEYADDPFDETMSPNRTIKESVTKDKNTVSKSNDNSLIQEEKVDISKDDDMFSKEVKKDDPFEDD